jgi:hypothetical protein
MGIVMLLRQFRRSNFKIALLTTAAIIGLHAQGFAAPIQYVRVCDAFGQGSFNIPGTDTCLRLSGGVQAGYGGTTTNFNVNPNFDVSGSGTVYGVNAMALFGVVNTGLSVGPRLQYFGGRMGGSTFYPSSGGTYDVTTRGSFAADLVAQYTPASWGGASVRGFAGIIDTRSATAYNVVRTFAPALVGSDTSSNVGFTAGIGANIPIPSGFTGVSLTGEVRYFGGTATYNIPGSVGTHRDSVVSTLGLEYSFTAK